MPGKIIYIAVFTILIVTVLYLGFRKSDKTDKKQTLIFDNSENRKSEFDWDNLTTLVIYATDSDDADPDEYTESLSFPEYDSDENFLHSDNAPYLSVLNKVQMLDFLQEYQNKSTKSEHLTIIKKITAWVKSQNHTWFMYELEPPELAGKAYLIAKKAEHLQ